MHPQREFTRFPKGARHTVPLPKWRSMEREPYIKTKETHFFY